MRGCARFAFALLMVLAAPPLFARATATTLHTASSESFTVYVDGPANARAGVLLVHDWFGVSPFYTEAAARLAAQGYRVLALDLYRGHSATTHDQASKLLESVHDDVAAREINAAVAQLAEGGRQVAVMGFSMGARHALATALRNKGVHATVLWYGETVKDPEKLRQLAGPALLIVGSQDGSTAAADAAAFSKAADTAGAGAEVYLYPGADHAFAQRARQRAPEQPCQEFRELEAEHLETALYCDRWSGVAPPALKENADVLRPCRCDAQRMRRKSPKGVTL